MVGTEKRQAVRCIDVVVGGDVLRMVVDGLPNLKAGSPADALAELRRDHDEFRRFVTEPPRGYAGLIACLLLPAFSQNTARTAVVAPAIGYVPVAATPLMAAATSLITLREVKPTEPVTMVHFDTANGPVAIEVTVKSGNIVSTRWCCERPTLISRDKVKLANGLVIPVTIVFSGLPYGVVSASDLNIDFEDRTVLGKGGASVCDGLNQQHPLRGLGLDKVANQYHVMIVDNIQEAPEPKVQVACVGQSGWVFNTPAGTGALSVGAHFQALDLLDYGPRLETYTPFGGRLYISISPEQAFVDASCEVVAELDLYGAP